MTLLLTEMAAAFDYRCPQKIAYPENVPLSRTIIPELTDVYQKLGCKVTRMKGFPGRRSIAEFNAGRTDGIAARSPEVEKHLTVDYVRSAIPILNVDIAFWIHPDKVQQENRPFGYVLGVIHHEEFLAEKHKRGFVTTPDLVEAYNAGHLGGFVMPDRFVHELVQSGKLSPSPVIKERLEPVVFYHYTHQKFAPFMTFFSDYVTAHFPTGLRTGPLKSSGLTQ